MAEARKVLARVSEKFGFHHRGTANNSSAARPSMLGQGAARRTPSTACEQSDAILFGSVGGPKWEKLPPNEQPERARAPAAAQALRPLRQPAPRHVLSRADPRLADQDGIIADGFDVLWSANSPAASTSASRRRHAATATANVAVDTMVYKKSEIERIAHVAFKAAQARRKQRHARSTRPTCSRTACSGARPSTEVAKQYPDVKLDHHLRGQRRDAARQATRSSFDVCSAKTSSATSSATRWR